MRPIARCPARHSLCGSFVAQAPVSCVTVLRTIQTPLLSTSPRKSVRTGGRAYILFSFKSIALPISPNCPHFHSQGSPQMWRIVGRESARTTNIRRHFTFLFNCSALTLLISLAYFSRQTLSIIFNISAFSTLSFMV